MKILMLTPYLPYPLLSGGQIRTYNLLKNLANKHDITLFAYIRKDSERQHIAELEKFCSKVRLFKRRPAWDIQNILGAGFSPYPFLVTIYLSPGFQHAIKKELAQGNYNLIHAETFYMMPNLPKTKIPIILAEQTIEHMAYLTFTQTTKAWPIKPFLYYDVAKIKRWEKHFWKTATRLIAMSAEDKQSILKELKTPVPIDIVANGVDIPFFSHTRKNLPKDPTVLFVGTFKWLPNIDAVEFLVEEIWPKIIKSLPSAKLLIAGFSPSAKIKAYSQDHSITVRGDIEDIRQAYSQAHLLLAPIRSGKGTRYKILEAMATATPIVATNLAVEGIGVKNNTHALLADTADSLAAAAIHVLTNDKLRKELATNSQQLVSSQYNWQTIAQELDRVYSTVGAVTQPTQ